MSGDAYIEMVSLKDVKDALKMNNKTIGRRYIEGRLNSYNIYIVVLY